MLRERIVKPGQAIGPFRVVRLLATGGMANVYEARPHPVEREDFITMGMTRVALKVPRLEALAHGPRERRQLVERLEREYQTLLKLAQSSHPNLVDVYEFGWHRGTPFLVLEYVEGVPLDEVLARQPPLAVMLELFRKLCGVVAFLHDHDVRHRDIKPSNVLVRDGEPVLIDLGICMPATGWRLTGPGELVATPLYASPQAAAHYQDPLATGPYLGSAADDVWALGMVLYEMLTGDVPWRAAPGQREALLREIRQGPLRHPSEVNPAMPRDLGDVALRLLERKEGRRPPNAAAALKVLEPALRRVPLPLRVPQRLRPLSEPSEPVLRRSLIRPPQWWRVRAGRAAVAAALVVGIGLGLVGNRALEALWDARRSSAPAAGGVAGQPLPSGPLPGQRRPPCPEPYMEANGGCWDEFQTITPDGKPRPCPQSDQIREMKGKDGRWRCYIAVMMPPSRNAETPEKGGR